MELFTTESIWTMIHGIVLGGGAMLALAAALYELWVTAPAESLSPRRVRYFTGLNAATTVLLWLSVLVGSFVVFPIYRVPPPEGVTDLSEYPRAFLMATPGLAWLHTFAMEIKEHMPWTAAMLSTAVTFVTARGPARVFTDPDLRRTVVALIAICFALVAFISLLGVFVNKVAPVD